MTQHQKILALLRQRQSLGINSFDARRELNIIQLPVRIKELRQLGHTILVKQNKNRSVQYILIEKPRIHKPEKTLTENPKTISFFDLL